MEVILFAGSVLNVPRHWTRVEAKRGSVLEHGDTFLDRVEVGSKGWWVREGVRDDWVHRKSGRLA